MATLVHISVSEPGAPIRVLHVDDQSDFAEMAAEFLERESDRITVHDASSADDGKAQLAEKDYDCVVSDYDMPRTNGIEFLEAVREDYPDLPFILFTGKGSEEIASEAISAGVTDYLQKQSGSSQFTVLANRIENAVEQYRTQREIEETRTWYETILKHSSDYVMIVDGNGIVRHVTPPIETVMGYEPAEVVGTNAFDFVHEDDLESAMSALAQIAIEPDREQSVEYRAEHKEGGWRWLEVRGRNLMDNPVIEGVLVNVRDITKRKEREQALERQKNRLEDLTSFLSHDLKNQLTLIEGRLGMADADSDDEHLAKAREVADRMAEMIDSFAELSKKGQIPTSTEPVDIEALVESCWRRLRTDNATIQIDDGFTVHGDHDQLQSLFENLLQNAVKHAGPEVTVRIGLVPEGDGFYVEDDGPGIAVDGSDPEEIFTPGYSTTDRSDGFGLAFVRHIAEAHGWDVEVTEGESGGARFEFHGIPESSLE